MIIEHTKNMQIDLREAVVADIPQIQKVRNSVNENTLSDPALIPDKDVEDYIMRRGKGWVAESGGTIIGFSVVSLMDKNVWALFIQPGFDKKGVGRKLHDMMLNWYFSKTTDLLWLSTTPGTRADKFYRSAGWKEAGVYGKGETKFEMTAEKWKNNNIVLRTF